MNYTKPEAAVLGQAARVIEFTGVKQTPGISDAPLPGLKNPAYDLDE